VRPLVASASRRCGMGARAHATLASDPHAIALASPGHPRRARPARADSRSSASARPRQLALFGAIGPRAGACFAGLRPPLCAEIGFVFPRPCTWSIRHNSFPSRYFPFIPLRQNWGCFTRCGPAAPSRATLPALGPPCPWVGNWLCLARSVPASAQAAGTDLGAFVRMEIGFVFPRPCTWSIVHNSFPIQYLPFVALSQNWVCFTRCGPAAPSCVTLPPLGPP
jgi:hypothetical protein